MLSFKQYMQKLDENQGRKFDVTTQEELDQIVEEAKAELEKTQPGVFTGAFGFAKLLMGEDGKVRVLDTDDKTVCITENFVNDSGFLKVDFIPMSCNFTVRAKTLKSLLGFPKKVKSFVIPEKHPGLPPDFENYPKEIKNELAIPQFNGNSLIGFSKAFEYIGGVAWIPLKNITRGGIELINVKGLDKIADMQSIIYNKRWNEAPSYKAFEIIRKYLGHPDKIFECQAELIDNGLEAYAEL